MSFDLFVCDADAIAPETPQEFYAKATGGTAASKPSESFQDFLQALFAEYPPMEGLSLEDAEESPWASDPEAGPGHCLLLIRWGREQEVLKFVASIAGPLGLVVYDPQANALVKTPKKRKRPAAPKKKGTKQVFIESVAPMLRDRGFPFRHMTEFFTPPAERRDCVEFLTCSWGPIMQTDLHLGFRLEPVEEIHAKLDPFPAWENEIWRPTFEKIMRHRVTGMVAWERLIGQAPYSGRITSQTPDEAVAAAHLWMERLDSVSHRYFGRIPGVAQFADAFLKDDKELKALVNQKAQAFESPTIAIALTYGPNAARDYLERESPNIPADEIERLDRLRALLGVPKG